MLPGDEATAVGVGCCGGTQGDGGLKGEGVLGWKG